MVTSRRLESLSPAELVDVAAAAKRLSTYAEALGLEAGDRLRRNIEGDVRRGDDIGEEEAAADAQREASVELAAALAETKHRTACRLHLVRRLKAELPQVWTLVRAGRLDVYQADEVIAHELAVVQDRSLVPGLLDALIAELEATTPSDATRGDGIGLVGLNPTRTRGIVRRLVASAQPDVTQKRFQRGYAQRRMHTGAGSVHGMGELWLSHSIDRVTGISHRLGLLARALPADDPRSMDQRIADPDSVWCRMLTDAGRFVELSTDAYKPDAALSRSVVVRDRTCVGVGCAHPADTEDLDHSCAHAEGGPTSESNLGPACRGHHPLKDGGGFTLAQGEPGTFRWTYPSGHAYTRQPLAWPEGTWPVTAPGADDRNTESAKAVPASAADIREGLALLEAERRREAAAELDRRRLDVAEERLRSWRKWFGDDERPPAEDAVDYWGSLAPADRAELRELIA